ncbi:Uncharacterised protein [uncultured archaeon]|nr:Uncharacterised protein [uncultured archaeon]
MIEAVTASFALAFLAELGDKTQLAVLALTAKGGDKWKIFAGSPLGLTLAVAVSVLLGGAVSTLVPFDLLKVAAALGFVAFGIYSFFEPEEKCGEASGRKGKAGLGSSAVLLFVMEMGDKTQLANFLLAARYPAEWVFVGAALAMALVAGLTVYLGAKACSLVSPKIVKKASAVLFVLVGIATLFF